jgi:hypothetical protein
VYYVYKITSEVNSTGETHEYYLSAYYDNIKKLSDGTIDADLVNLNKGLSVIDLYTGIDGCPDIDTVYTKNVADYEEEYNIVSTVK